MKVLAIDTATERCSVALRIDGQTIERCVETPRGHADLILPMTQEVLDEAGVGLKALDGIAYGRGPGAFTGVRIAVGVVQGLAFGADLPTVGISDLAAVAQQVVSPAAAVLVCMDARMNEVYWGEFTGNAAGLAVASGAEHVGSAASVSPTGSPDVLAGTGFGAFPELAARYAPLIAQPLLPLASRIALLAEPLLRDGQGVPAERAQPVYLRDNVAVARKS